ncbi:MAG TPA: hypothetical protein VNH15_00225 [Elusimicrobiota bacterium]|nr:hypothetical protein [Elusimicrobiota bacterium]
MNNRRLSLVLAVLAAGSLSISSVRAAEEAVPEQADLALSPALTNFAPDIAPISPVAILDPSLAALPAAALTLPAPIAQQLPLFSALQEAAVPEIPNAPVAASDHAQAPAAAKSAHEASAEKTISAMAQGLRKPLEAAADAHSSADGSAEAGRSIEAILSGQADIDGAQFDFPEAMAVGGHGHGGGRAEASLPWTPVNPAEFYAQALAEAAHTAQRYGVKPEDVNLGEIKGTFSSMDARELSYEFYIQPGKAEKNSGIIYVDFSRSWAQPGQRMGARVATFITNPKEHEIEPRHLGAEELAKKIIYSPYAALEAARKRFPALTLHAAYLLSLDKRDGGKDFWYHIYDASGHAVAVNARTAEAADMLGNASLKNVKKNAVAENEPSGLPREIIEKAAQSAAMYKGMPYSQSEYEASVYEIAQKLIARGASEEDIKLYRELCDKAPIQGGRFNPWAGD